MCKSIDLGSFFYHLKKVSRNVGWLVNVNHGKWIELLILYVFMEYMNFVLYNEYKKYRQIRFGLFVWLVNGVGRRARQVKMLCLFNKVEKVVDEMHE